MNSDKKLNPGTRQIDTALLQIKQIVITAGSNILIQSCNSLAFIVSEY